MSSEGNFSLIDKNDTYELSVQVTLLTELPTSPNHVENPIVTCPIKAIKKSHETIKVH